VLFDCFIKLPLEFINNQPVSFRVYLVHE
jgi:hypothetical protein